MNQMKTLLAEKYKIATDYPTYLNEVKKLVNHNKTTGPNQSADMVHYTLLALKRMQRWDKTLTLPSQIEIALKQNKTKFYFLAITEAWCGDASHLLPVFNLFSEYSHNIDYKVILRDEHPDLMQHFLTNTAKSIPILIVMNSDFEVCFSWGPRPFLLQQRVIQYKQKQDKPFLEFLQETQVWYNQDKGLSAVNEIYSQLRSFLA